MAQTDVLPDVEEEVSEFDGQAHYVRILVLVRGGPVVALCGKKYIPRVVGASVLDMPVCPKCANLMEILKMMEAV